MRHSSLPIRSRLDAIKRFHSLPRRGKGLFPKLDIPSWFEEGAGLDGVQPDANDPSEKLAGFRIVWASMRRNRFLHRRFAAGLKIRNLLALPLEGEARCYDCCNTDWTEETTVSRDNLFSKGMYCGRAEFVAECR